MNAGSHWTVIDGTTIHYLAAGETGSPVVLLHGGGVDSARLSWQPVIERLAATHRVYAPDWPGYGHSALVAGKATTGLLIGMLTRLMDHWGLERVTLVGLSMGGGVGIGYALACPERVERLVLVGSFGLQQRVPFHKLFYFSVRFPGLTRLGWASLRRSRSLAKLALQAIIHNPASLPGGLVEEIFQAIQRTDAGHAFDTWQRSEVLWHGLRTCYTNRLQEIAAPTLVVHGAQDRLVPVACARGAARKIPRATLRVFPDCGHWPQREKPAAFEEALTAFLSDAG